MEEYQFAFRSLTKAQQAAHALRLAGVNVAVHRTSGACRNQNCGYAAFVPIEERQKAEAIFAHRGIVPERGCEGGAGS